MSFSNYYVSKFEDSAESVHLTIEEVNELARYAPHLSAKMLEFFPDVEWRDPSDRPKPSPRMPARLRKRLNIPPKDIASIAASPAVIISEVTCLFLVATGHLFS